MRVKVLWHVIINMFVHASGSEYTHTHARTHADDHQIYIQIKRRCSLFNKRLMSIIVIMVLDIDNGWAIGD